MLEKISQINSSEAKRIIIDLSIGCFLGIGINFFFNYQILIEPSSNEQILSRLLLISPLILTGIRLFTHRATRKTLRIVLWGIFFISTVFAINSFYQNVEWFSRGGYATIPNIYVMDLEGKRRLLTIYPPELIFNLMKAVFIGSVSGFAGRLIKK